MTLNDLFQLAIERKASDIHLATGESIRLRVDGKLELVDDHPLDASQFESLLGTWSRGDLPAREAFFFNGYAIGGVVYACGCHNKAATFRLMPDGVPPLSKVAQGGLDYFQEIAKAPRGLIIVSGLGGSGKTTTLCSLVDHINETTDSRLYLVEGQLGHHLTSKRGMLTQMQVGPSEAGYLSALDIAFEADFDIIAVDETATADVLRRLIQLAVTGHLVIANLHASSAIDALQRLIETSYSEREALCRALAQCLVAISTQQLHRTAAGSKVAAYEWLRPDEEMRQALAAGDLDAVAALQLTSEQCRTMEAAVQTLEPLRTVS